LFTPNVLFPCFNLDLKGYSFPHENKIRRKLGLDTSVLLTKSAKDERARRDERLLAPSK